MVDTGADYAFILQKPKRLFKRDDTGVRVGKDGVIAAGKIAEVENDRVYRSGRGVPIHLGMADQMKLRAVPKPFFVQQLLGRIDRLLLNIKRNDLSLFSDQFTKKRGILSPSHRRVDAQSAAQDLMRQKFMSQPQCVQFHAFPSKKPYLFSV